jgi:hypothetical protein
VNDGAILTFFFFVKDMAKGYIRASRTHDMTGVRS